jgi:hypothetical protein
MHGGSLSALSFWCHACRVTWLSPVAFMLSMYVPGLKMKAHLCRKAFLTLNPGCLLHLGVCK